MPRIAQSQPQPGSPSNPIPLPREKKTLLRYYKGERLRSPMGGHLDVMGIREGCDGHGKVMLECNTSSLRYLLEIPKATYSMQGTVAILQEQVVMRSSPLQTLTGLCLGNDESVYTSYYRPCAHAAKTLA